MMKYKKSKNEAGSKAYLTIPFGNRTIQTEVTVLAEKGNKFLVTTDYKQTALVDKFLVSSEKIEKKISIGDQMYRGLIYKDAPKFRGEMNV